PYHVGKCETPLNGIGYPNATQAGAHTDICACQGGGFSPSSSARRRKHRRLVHLKGGGAGPIKRGTPCRRVRISSSKPPRRFLAISPTPRPSTMTRKASGKPRSGKH